MNQPNYKEVFDKFEELSQEISQSKDDESFKNSFEKLMILSVEIGNIKNSIDRQNLQDSWSLSSSVSSSLSPSLSPSLSSSVSSSVSPSAPTVRSFAESWGNFFGKKPQPAKSEESDKSEETSLNHSRISSITTAWLNLKDKLKESKNFYDKYFTHEKNMDFFENIIIKKHISEEDINRLKLIFEKFFTELAELVYKKNIVMNKDQLVNVRSSIEEIEQTLYENESLNKFKDTYNIFNSTRGGYRKTINKIKRRKLKLSKKITKDTK